MINKIARQIATCFMVGYTPRCPGTIASALTALVFFLAPDFSCLNMMFFLALSLPFLIWASGHFAKQLAVKDPSCIVIDEFVGMLIALIALPKVWWLYLIAFGLFRVFDIAKPFPVYRAELLPGGWGIVMDDVVAGLMARGVLYVILAI